MDAIGLTEVSLVDVVLNEHSLDDDSFDESFNGVSLFVSLTASLFESLA